MFPTLESQIQPSPEDLHHQNVSKCPLSTRKITGDWKEKSMQRSEGKAGMEP